MSCLFKHLHYFVRFLSLIWQFWSSSTFYNIPKLEWMYKRTIYVYMPAKLLFVFLKEILIFQICYTALSNSCFLHFTKGTIHKSLSIYFLNIFSFRISMVQVVNIKSATCFKNCICTQAKNFKRWNKSKKKEILTFNLNACSSRLCSSESQTLICKYSNTGDIDKFLKHSIFQNIILNLSMWSCTNINVYFHF